MRAGLQHQRGAVEILGDLLKAELAAKTARSIRYQMSAALAIVLGPMADNGSLPVMKTLAEFDFDASPVNEAMVRALHDGDFLDETRNAVFVGDEPLLRHWFEHNGEWDRQEPSGHHDRRYRGQSPTPRPVLQRRPLSLSRACTHALPGSGQWFACKPREGISSTAWRPSCGKAAPGGSPASISFVGETVQT